MPVISLRYHFDQPLAAGARRAFEWATDFQPSDGELFSHRTFRRVRRLTPDAFLLTDVTFPEGRRREIQRLVRIDREELAWTNTHLTGPFQHSQFWYRILPVAPQKSLLSFRGLKLEKVPHPLGPEEISRRARENMLSDAKEWRDFLAPALREDLRKG